MTFTADHLVALSRPAGLALSPDGRRLVAGVSQLNDAGTGYRSALWSLALPDGEPVEALSGGYDDAAPVFAWDGSLLHLSDRPHPDGREGATLWRQPADGGEPVPVLTVPGGILSVVASAGSPVVVVKALLHPSAADLASDADVDAGTALVFDDYPVRWWDSWLGPRTPRLLTVDLSSGTVTDLTGPGGGAEWCDVYGHLCAVTPDGGTVLANRRRHLGAGAVCFDLVAVTASGVRVLADPGVPDADHFAPAVSPDGRYVVATRRHLGSPDEVERWTLVRFELTTGAAVDLLPGWDAWPLFAVWSRDGGSVLFTADAQGRQPVFSVDADGGEPTTVAEDASYDTLVPTPEGRLLAVRSSVVDPPLVVEVGGRVLPFLSAPELPGRVEEVRTTVADGSVVRSWLVLPPGCSAESPAPMATWLHGGPAGSWNRWDWRWCPHVFASQGWALLLPDVAQSTGYGGAFQGRGRGDWQGAPVTDVLEVVAAVSARPDVDASRLTAGGGSFGGYLTNALAVREHPFKALVAACSIWSLDQHRGTSDSGAWGEREFGPQPGWRAGLLASSPEVHADRLSTPMLVIHGERDMRVPIDQALRLWTDLRTRDVEARLLVFTDEGHHIPSRPGNVVRVYEEVFRLFERHAALPT